MELIPMIKNGFLRFNRDHRLLLEQLLGFPKLTKDDGPDALQQAVTLIVKGPAMDPFLIGTDSQSRYNYNMEDEFDSFYGGSGQRLFYS